MRWLARGLFAAGAAALGWCLFVIGEGLAYRELEGRRFDAERQQNQSDDVFAASNRTARTAVAPKRHPVDLSGVFGRVDIARLGLSVMVGEGVDSPALRRSAGHIPGTGFPGGTGNIGISAHRDTYFRRLKDVRIGDVVALSTVLATYRYRVVSTTIVEPSNIEVLDPNGGEVLTLITCYPFYFIGEAPNRFVVRAERIH